MFFRYSKVFICVKTCEIHCANCSIIIISTLNYNKMHVFICLFPRVIKECLANVLIEFLLCHIHTFENKYRQHNCFVQIKIMQSEKTAFRKKYFSIIRLINFFITIPPHHTCSYTLFITPFIPSSHHHTYYILHNRCALPCTFFTLCEYSSTFSILLPIYLFYSMYSIFPEDRCYYSIDSID